MMFVTMSAADPMSSWAAAASWSVSGMAPRMSSVFMPAMARKFIASAASLALNCVVAPSSRACSRRASSSSPVALLTAATWFIAAWKSPPALSAPTPTAIRGALTCVVRLRPALLNVRSIPPRRCSAWLRPALNSSALKPSVANTSNTFTVDGPPLWSGFDGWPVEPAEALADFVHSPLSSHSRAVFRFGREHLHATPTQVRFERLVLLASPVQEKLLRRLVVRQLLVNHAKHLHEPRVQNLGENAVVTPPGEFVPADQVEASCERVCISGSFRIRTLARTKKAFTS